MSNQFNEVPERMRRISLSTFMEAITKNVIILTELRQPTNWAAKPYGSVDLKMFNFSDNTGVAVAPSYFKGIAQYAYFMYGCDHDYIEVRKNGTEKTLQCQKCNRVKIIDSSD